MAAAHAQAILPAAPPPLLFDPAKPSVGTPPRLSPSLPDPAAELTESPSFFRNTVSNTSRAASQVVAHASDLVLNALSLIGVRYRYGGDTPDSGLDCSGFVRYVFNDTLGFSLPRRSADMSRVGEKITKDELEPGDLVFFNTMKRAFSHVGIYVGDNKFVHAPSTGSQIRVDDMQAAYWSHRYNGARRVDTENEQPINLY
ncbi:MAG: C40 family peptidase, partial [Ottowia sp.]|nr:C40 family peptidase [Ottowia sp.]